MDDINRLTERIIGCAIEVHRHLGPGLLEGTYELALCIELSDAGLKYERQVAVPVVYKGRDIGEYRLDIMVEDAVIVEIKTVEGVASGEELHAVQQAMIETGGAQCGICTPGMVLAAVSLLERNPRPTEADIREGLAGNLCRCTGYMKIFDAVVKAVKQ